MDPDVDKCVVCERVASRANLQQCPLCKSLAHASCLKPCDCLAERHCACILLSGRRCYCKLPAICLWADSDSVLRIHRQLKAAAKANPGRTIELTTRDESVEVEDLRREGYEVVPIQGWVTCHWNYDESSEVWQTERYRVIRRPTVCACGTNHPSKL